MLLSLGAPLRQAQKDTLNRVLPDRLYELYGVTEGLITVLDRADAVRKAARSASRRRSTKCASSDEQGRECARETSARSSAAGPVSMPGYDAGRTISPPRRCATAGSFQATLAMSTLTATCSWSIARRT